MSRKGSTLDREKVNFMISRPVLSQLKEWIPAGERSDFVESAVEEALIDYRRRKASDAMDRMRENSKLTISTAEIIRLKNYGRK